MLSSRMQGVSFQTFASEDIKKQSVKEITNPETFDDLLHPNAGGLYDGALGPTDRSDLCHSCGMNYVHCPGHLGHIELPLPVYHPIYFKIFCQFLNLSCYGCHSLLISRAKEHLFLKQLLALDNGQPSCIGDLEDCFNAALADDDFQKMGGNDMDDNIINRIDSLFNSARDAEQADAKVSKNATKYRQVLIKGFFGTSKVKICPRCKAPVRYFRAEYNSRLYLKALSSNDAKRYAAMQKAGKTVANGDDVNGSGVQDDDNNLKQEEEEEDVDGRTLSKQKFINPVEARAHLQQVFQKSKPMLKALFGDSLNTDFNSIEMFFLAVIAVPPSRFRPISTLGEKRFENPQTANLNKVLVDCKLIYKCLEETQRKDDGVEDTGTTVLKLAKRKRNSAPIAVSGKTPAERLQNAWIKLQIDINCFMDSDLDKISLERSPGIRQLLEKKEGLFRKHMMGKRVNYAARSVISPDPYLNTDEIGIPEVFAKKLTYPQPVTPWNCQQLRRAVINGPNVHPGAVMIEHEDGRKVILNASNATQREAIAKRLLTPSTNQKPVLGCKKVYRHLINGDVLLLNRQPTLHRPSIMAHKARVLPNERTIRLHYANCKAYNADFDGDEMNAHFPQNELGRAEAYNLVSTNFQYLSPKDGKPLSGLIQDHVVSGVTMTSRGVMLKKEDYQQIVFGALTDKPGKVLLLPPCILKPEPLWSGKQLLSTVLINSIPEKSSLNLNSKAKINDMNWPKATKRNTPLNADMQRVAKDPNLNEMFVVIRDGEVLTGILDKSQYGSSQFGLVHCVYELYGGQTSGKLLSALARLFTHFLRVHGFSLGVEDILVTPKANSRRSKLIDAGRLCGNEAAASALGLPEDCQGEELFERLQKAQHSNQGVDLKQLDLAMKKQTDLYNNKINSACVPHGLCRQFPDNSLQLMVQSGAKGSSVNCMQISSLLGQIELEGRRPPLMLSGRSLPSFVAYDTSPRAGGFVDGRFLTGIRPQEYFFHCMAGREGLVDTAVKTSRSGYLQRCLIKHLEGLMVQYDLSVRDSDGSVVQFLYGDDGVDVLKAQFLEEKQFQFIARNHTGYMRQLKPHRAMKVLDLKEATKKEKRIKKWKAKYGKPTSSKLSHTKRSPYLLFERDHGDTFKSKYPDKDLKNGRTKASEELFKIWRKLSGQVKHSYESNCMPCPDPVVSVLSPDRYLGSVSEAFLAKVFDYASLNPDGLLGDDNASKVLKSNQFSPLMTFKYSRALVEPGEAVGLLAGQSIGEPSTQMTLNTFHFAGRGEMNVTLGIPRLREVLMTASSNIKTPTMDVLVKEGSVPLKKAEKLQKQLNRVTLSNVIEKMEVFETLKAGQISSGRRRCRQFKIRMEFLHRSVYKDEYTTTPKDILLYVEQAFVRRILAAVKKLCKIKTGEKQVKTLDEKQPNVSNEEAEGGDQDAFMAEDENDDIADISDDELVGDGDAADSKNKSRQMQFTSYEEPDEDEQTQDEDEGDSDDEDLAQKQKGEMTESVMDDIEIVDDQQPISSAAEEANNEERDTRITSVVNIPSIVEYKYDVKKNLWCEVSMQFPVTGSKIMLLSLIEKLAEKAVVNEAPGIKRAFFSESSDRGEEGRHRIKTEGVSIIELWQYPEILELKNLYSNDIHAMARTYGIEAARQIIIKMCGIVQRYLRGDPYIDHAQIGACPYMWSHSEITNVFKVYGIQIDRRHLSLVGDYMTFEGSYKPFNRQGIESNPYPLQKMTFETTTHFLREASAFGRVDTLDSPSSRIVVGRVVKAGTGIFDLRQPLKW